jgi:hypothetical protein
MQSSMQRLRNALFGGVVASAMLFGGTQAVAAPANPDRCQPPNVWLGLAACPTGKLCGEYCTSGEGECLNGCCMCLT